MLLALAPMSAYLTRVMSATNTTIAREFAASDKVMGTLISGFALGYFVFQIPGGVLASTLGVRVILPLMSVAWSVCAVWGSFARSIDELWLSRVVMGVAQAALVPCCAHAIANWFPIARRGIASSVIAGSMQVGGILATQLTGHLLDPFGWRGALQAYALTGGLFAVPFFLIFRNRPEESKQVNAAERELIARGRIVTPGIGVAGAPSPPEPSSNWWKLTATMAASVSIWAYLTQAVLRAYAYEFFTSWSPAFMEKGYGVSPKDAASLAVLPLWTLGIGSLISGYIVDWVQQRTGNRWLSRSGTAMSGLAACGVCFAVATVISDPAIVMYVLALGALFASLGGPATWAATMDLGGRRAAVLAGIMNMMGNIGSYFCPRHVGRLFEWIETSSGNWNLVLWLFVGVNLACALSWVFVDSRRCVLD